ncbi:hypothetical protein TEA_007445 [Camellia sinensis var. sinensis]|uniref:Thiol-disulfide oxidoreductase DCC n=1 Tax=Camellia sinensis var. sinensis TaxID=542762 RepID=A0A4V3WJ94_CAMSN|nr:hypothetical protein TEA_007445 [Camellia sinensis var. sinensis]
MVMSMRGAVLLRTLTSGTIRTSSPSISSWFSSTSSSSPSDLVFVPSGSAADLLPVSAKVSTVPSLLQPRVVVYDGVCHLCHKDFVALTERMFFVDSCSLKAPVYITKGPLKLDQQSLIQLFGELAALRVLSYLPLPYSALSTLLILPMPLRDAVYDYVAKRRYDWFGKEDDCLVLQEKELLERFIDREEMLDHS